ncbi:hypothetical protein F4808DRAFT_431062 [Astrocystis sublimbata]|nr:hypothetical protein F4808DRAFT_431041 [Astrocystis sublimbata]KAI0199999.1 hypothetical protein F4808DRAFT_431062 [Astrocystis sublimbata]
MRPVHPGDARTAASQHHRPHLMARPPTSNIVSFCVADEAALDARGHAPVIPPPHSAESKKVNEGLPPVGGRHLREDRVHKTADDDASFSPLSEPPSDFWTPASPPSQSGPSSSPRPITPTMLASSAISSIGSSSPRTASFESSLSDDDDVQSYDLPSVTASDSASATSMLGRASAPQLVMPSISMPSRRPFTETGKNLGHLKVLLAGESGVGKTSLLKAIVQSCHHIVHVDPISPLNRSAFEVHASTKSYPGWWHELGVPSISHQRKSREGNVLERNLCFVDTPGYGCQQSVMGAIKPCVDYVESHLNKLSSPDLSEPDLMSMLGGDGGCQVDVVLYLISHRLKAADLEYMRCLAALTNVIPILSRADLLSAEQIGTSKQRIAAQLASSGIQPFSFTSTADLEEQEWATPTIPYTTSSVTRDDHETMDASILMKSDYIEPLIPTDLAFLVDKMFSVDGASWLRHSAAKKYLQWRESTPRRPRDLYQLLSSPVCDYSTALTRRSDPFATRHDRQPSGPGPGPGVRYEVADWATDLQRSQAAERQRYEALLRGEHAIWLTEKLGKCVQDGSLTATSPGHGAVTNNGSNGGRRSPRGKRGASKTQQHQDPLGLLQATLDMKAKSWLAVEIASGLGLIGLAGLACWVGWPSKAIGRMNEWCMGL